MSYESPITLITEIEKDLMQAEEEGVMQAVWKTGVDVDKDELIRALNYDRGQYDKGYADGKRDAMKWISVEDRLPTPYTDVLIVEKNALRTRAVAWLSQHRDCWITEIDGECFYTPIHHVDYWAELSPPPEVKE